MSVNAQTRQAIRSHSTATSDDPWDAGAQVARLPSEEAALREAHAWVDPEGDPNAKSSYKFPHHFVSGAGDVGAASTRACSAGIAVLNGGRGGADIPEEDRQGVWDHLARHLRDAGEEPPPLRAGSGAREIRSFPAELQVRTSEAGTTVIEGYAAVFDVPYQVTDWLGDYTEVIRLGAFAKTLADRADVKFFYNHDGLALARSKSGTLKLWEDSRGLRYEAEVDLRQQAARDLVIAIERGDLDQSSFAFRATRQAWNEDYSQREILEAALYDVSTVAWPANPATTAGIRGAARLLEAVRGLRPEAALAELREGKVLSAKNQQLLQEAIAALQAILDAASGGEASAEEPSRDASPMLSLELAEAQLVRRRLSRAG
jgi:HK97 family phage prohead protease